MKREASAVWEGGLKNGKGIFSTASGVISDEEYGFASRFGDAPGTNPEELVAAAHASCFAMALAHELEQVKLKPKRISVHARAELNQAPEGWAITEMFLSVHANVPGAEQEKFNLATENAKKNCPISRLIRAPIRVNVELDAATDSLMSQPA